jgi:hypothetical protein
MFKRIKETWNLERAKILRSECSDLMKHRVDLLMSQHESVDDIKKGSEYCLSHFNEQYGPLNKLDKKVKKKIVKEIDKWKQDAFKRNIPMAMGYGIISIWLESSYLPGNNAIVVHDITTKVLSEQMDLQVTHI